ncbi:hypothetical protein HYW44_00920 [Candidatus Daviesbacteria bacterium]|nr:hypothetical protein [Candidatus Daviesbacteria bacterium]
MNTPTGAERSGDSFPRRQFFSDLAKVSIATGGAALLTVVDRSPAMPVLDAIASLTPPKSPLTREQILASLGDALATPAAFAQAECTGPNVPCLVPDEIARYGFFQVNRVLRNERGENFAISDAAVGVYLMQEVGSSNYPKYDLQNPILGPDGLPIAFLDEKTGKYREVRESLLFVSAPKGSARFNGRLLLSTDQSQDTYKIIRPAGEVRDRVAGKRRDAQGCESACELNCALVAIWERRKSASNPATFRDSRGLAERDQTAIWLWPGEEKDPSTHQLTSFSQIPDSRIRDLIASGDSTPAVYIGPAHGNSNLVLVGE